MPAALAQAHGVEVTLAVRPEHLQWGEPHDPTPEFNTLAGTVRSSLFAGNVRHTGVDVAGGSSLLVESSAGQPAPEPGRQVLLRWHPRHTVLIPEGSPSSP